MEITMVNGNGDEVKSTAWVKCEKCGRETWRSDFPGQGGIVPDENGHLTCDDCKMVA